MTNMWEGLDPDDMPTAPYRVAGAGGSTGQGPGGAGPGGSGPGGTGRRRRLTAGLLIAAVAAGGGAFAVAETGSPASSAATPTSLSASSATSGDGAQLMALRAVLGGHGGLGRLARLRGLGGLYGQFTYETKSGPATLAFERGTIASVASGDIVVRATDGTTWSWDLTGTSVVRDDGKRATDSALAAGQLVFVGGPVTGGTRDARLVVISKAASGAA